MKKVWVRLDPWDEELARVALEAGADVVQVPEGMSGKVKKQSLVKTLSPDGDLRLDKEVICLEIRTKEDEKEALRLSKSLTVILSTPDWSIIPLENLVAQTEGIIAEASNFQEARTALQVLERGVDGVFVTSKDPKELRRIIEMVKGQAQTVELEAARITRTVPLALGDRVCIDTCSNMSTGEGILAGNTAQAMFLVHAETEENPFVAQRPFRVNAGALHAYTLLPGGHTKYLSELGAGDEVLIVNHQGLTQPAIVGRNKIERRPLLLVEAEREGTKVALILQNAETIRLVTPEGKPISVVDLKKGTEVLAHFEAGGRHFGMPVKETITER